MEIKAQYTKFMTSYNTTITADGTVHQFKYLGAIIIKFAGDTKLYIIIENEEDANNLQSHLNDEEM